MFYESFVTLRFSPPPPSYFVLEKVGTLDLSLLLTRAMHIRGGEVADCDENHLIGGTYEHIAPRVVQTNKRIAIPGGASRQASQAGNKPV